MTMQPESNKKTTNLVDPNEVLTDYLNALLGEVETVELTEQKLKSEPQADVTLETVVEQEDGAEVAIETEPGKYTDEFQILLFQVAGVSLAVSLEKLGGILEWSDDITPMPNHSPWFLGLLPERGQQTKIIDTAMLVVPSKFRTNHRREDMKKIIMVGGGKWGLACDSVSEVMTLRRDKVRWRGENSKRPWLAGMLVDQMCALLDIDEFVELLSSEKLEPAG